VKALTKEKLLDLFTLCETPKIPHDAQELPPFLLDAQKLHRTGGADAAHLMPFALLQLSRLPDFLRHSGDLQSALINHSLNQPLRTRGCFRDNYESDVYSGRIFAGVYVAFPLSFLQGREMWLYLFVCFRSLSHRQRQPWRLCMAPWIGEPSVSSVAASQVRSLFFS